MREEFLRQTRTNDYNALKDVFIDSRGKPLHMSEPMISCLKGLQEGALCWLADIANKNKLEAWSVAREAVLANQMYIMYSILHDGGDSNECVRSYWHFTDRLAGMLGRGYVDTLLVEVEGITDVCEGRLAAGCLLLLGLMPLDAQYRESVQRVLGNIGAQTWGKISHVTDLKDRLDEEKDGTPPEAELTDWLETWQKTDDILGAVCDWIPKAVRLPATTIKLNPTRECPFGTQPQARQLAYWGRLDGKLIAGESEDARRRAAELCQHFDLSVSEISAEKKTPSERPVSETKGTK